MIWVVSNLHLISVSFPGSWRLLQLRLVSPSLLRFPCFQAFWQDPYIFVQLFVYPLFSLSILLERKNLLEDKIFSCYLKQFFVVSQVFDKLFVSQSSTQILAFHSIGKILVNVLVFGQFFCLLHNSQCFTFPPQSCLLLANFLISLFFLSLSSHCVHFLFSYILLHSLADIPLSVGTDIIIKRHGFSFKVLNFSICSTALYFSISYDNKVPDNIISTCFCYWFCLVFKPFFTI